jgi:hypothetical protein
LIIPPDGEPEHYQFEAWIYIRVLPVLNDWWIFYIDRFNLWRLQGMRLVLWHPQQGGMAYDRGRFALREEGKDTIVFKKRAPRQASLRTARRLDT